MRAGEDVRVVGLRAGRLSGAALAALALLVSGAGGQEPEPPAEAAPAGPAPATRYDLQPRYAHGDRWEVEERLRLTLRVRLLLPAKNIDRTSEQAQVILRRHQNELTEVREGHVAEVRRRFVEAWEGVRLPGASSIERTFSPLHERTVAVRLDADGERVVEAADQIAAPIPEAALRRELHTERYEAVLPEEPVAVGAKWTVEGRRFRRALGDGLGRDARGKIACELVEVKEETLEEPPPGDELGAAPVPTDTIARVRLELEASARQGDEEDAPRLATEMEGELRFSLTRRRIVGLDLRGTARLRQTRREGDVVLEVDGRGPIELAKRFWVPEKPKERQ